METREAVKEGFERVELVVGIGYETRRTIAFQGRCVANDGKHTAYITPKGNILIYNDYNINGAEHLVYDSVDAASAAENRNGEPLYPPEFLAEIADEIGEEFVEELDI